jgi:hypothetical protein
VVLAVIDAIAFLLSIVATLVLVVVVAFAKLIAAKTCLRLLFVEFFALFFGQTFIATTGQLLSC